MGKWSKERLSNLLNVAQVVSGRASLASMSMLLTIPLQGLSLLLFSGSSEKYDLRCQLGSMEVSQKEDLVRMGKDLEMGWVLLNLFEMKGT